LGPYTFLPFGKNQTEYNLEKNFSESNYPADGWR